MSKQKPSKNDSSTLKSLVADFLEWLAQFFREQKKLEEVELMTYSEAVKYFVQARPKDNPTVVKGAIYRQQHPRGGYVLAWAFLNKDEKIVVGDEKGNLYGRQLLVHKLDKELRETFGNIDLIVVE